VIEVGEHADAALLDLGRDRILGVVDEVAVEVFGDDPLRLRLHPGGDEGGEVAPRISLEGHFLVDQPHRVERRHPAFGKWAIGGAFSQEAAAVDRRLSLGPVLLGHRSSSGLDGGAASLVETAERIPEPGQGQMGFPFDGGGRTRTGDLLGAIQGGRSALSHNKWLICSDFAGDVELPRNPKCAGISGDMRGFGHSRAGVPEISPGGSRRQSCVRLPVVPMPGACNPVVPLVPMTKTELHRLVDALPDESLPAAAILLRRAQDPVAATLDAAPYDDEELTDEDLRAIKEARSEAGISWSDIEAELNAG
jgi:hypothetical protein